jgi:hypothetical protein
MKKSAKNEEKQGNNKKVIVDEILTITSGIIQ